ncbi:hypothetical protein CFC21_005584 [Triticum aestivum]|uniref:DNA-directed RNA polymerase III subunit RPC3 n=1 Tax=Triticum aestivum TaxID=4565 RepID=A0A9R1IPC9_WHEAT|nr:hypothetical protein CFC21_005584 [Triticum aestivum]
MVPQHGILLAMGLISDHFGPLVAKVCDCLLRHGALQLPEIVRRLKLPPGQVKNSLLVLIQHNCVQAFSSTRGNRMVTLYLAIFDNVLHRLRFSKFISVIRADIPESEALIEGLLQNGRLTFDQLVGRTISKVPEGTIRPAREEIRINFNRLVYARYVERCPKPEPSFDPLGDEQSTSARRRVPKTAEEVLSLEQKVVNTANLSDPERFSEIPYSVEDASKTNDCPHNAVVGAKRKHGAFEVDEELNSNIAENEVLWRVNFDKFIFCLKKKFCADRKKPKLKVGTHPIWESFFEANLADRDTTNSVTSSLNGISEKLGQKEGGAAMTFDHITRVLEDLQCTTTSEDPKEFTFDLRKMVEACTNEEIIDTTILDKQIVHSTLYKLWNDGYIDTEKIASAAGTGYAQFFAWRARNTFREQFIDNLYHAALNLRQMVNYIAELLVEGSKDETKLRNRKNILILALTRHDDSLMLFHDF